MMHCTLFVFFIAFSFAHIGEAQTPEAEKFKEIEIQGSEQFKEQISKSLELLKLKTPEAYLIVYKYIRVIKQGKHSSMWAYSKLPTYEIADRTAFYSVTWCAGSISHDSLHSKLYHDHKNNFEGPVPQKVWTGVDAEKKCLAHQLEVLKKIGSPEHEIDHCKKQQGTHHDVNRDGKYDWEDFEKRNW